MNEKMLLKRRYCNIINIEKKYCIFTGTSMYKTDYNMGIVFNMEKIYNPIIYKPFRKHCLGIKINVLCKFKMYYELLNGLCMQREKGGR